MPVAVMGSLLCGPRAWLDARRRPGPAHRRKAGFELEPADDFASYLRRRRARKHASDVLSEALLAPTGKIKSIPACVGVAALTMAGTRLATGCVEPSPARREAALAHRLLPR